MPWPSCICLRSSLIELFLWASDWSPEHLCLSSSHFFLLYIDFCKETDQEWISFTDEIIRAVFLLPLPPFLVTGVFNNLHTMPLLAPSLAKCERNCDYLIDWRVPGEEISIKPPHIHLIPFRFKISSMLVHLFGPSTFSKFNILIDTDIIQIFSPENSWEIDLVKLTKKNPQMHKPL